MNWDWIGELHRRPAAVRVVAALVTMAIAVAVSRSVSWFVSRFAAAGIEIAFPTQTLYVKRAD